MSIAGCSSPKKETAKQVKSESKERIVATTVAVTEIMDALEVELVGVPTSSKTYRSDIKVYLKSGIQ